MKKKLLRMKHPDLQATLPGKTFRQISAESALKETIDLLNHELKLIHHWLNCKECMVELALNVGRYLGRGLPWYLNLANYPIDDGGPNPKDYKMGSYYQGENIPETIRFIKDRLTWAQKEIERILQERTNDLKKQTSKSLWSL